MKISTSVLAAGLVSIVALAVTAALFVSGDHALERLAFVSATIALVAPALAAALKAGQAAEQTNGNLDERIERAVGKVVGSRRAGDRVTVHETPRTDPAVLAPPPPAGDVPAPPAAVG